MSKRKPKIEVYKDKAGEYRWRAKASNGKIIVSSSEGFSSESECERNLERSANTLYKTECEEYHLKCFIMGLLMTVIQSPKGWYMEVANDCIKYMKHHKMVLDVPTAHEVLYPRMADYKARERKRIIDKEELPKSEKATKKV